MKLRKNCLYRYNNNKSIIKITFYVVKKKIIQFPWSVFVATCLISFFIDQRYILSLVLQHMNSRLVYNVDSRDTVEGNDVYSHLHQHPIDINVESDYDHALQQMTAEDDYSHMNAHSKNLALEPDYYGEAS